MSERIATHHGSTLAELPRAHTQKNNPYVNDDRSSLPVDVEVVIITCDRNVEEERNREIR